MSRGIFRRINLIRKLLLFVDAACGISPGFYTKKMLNSDHSGECVNFKDTRAC